MPSSRLRPCTGSLARRASVVVLCVLAGCTAESPDDAAPATTEGVTAISVTVPPERLTPFCQGMIELSEELRDREIDGEVGDTEALIIETYRDLVPEVPDVLAVDFRLVLDALEAGATPPTDPPTTTPVPSAVATAPVVTTPTTGTLEGDPFFDEGYGPGRSPTERINEYVEFACRDTGNNPGPPATQPLEEPTEGDETDDDPVDDAAGG